MRAGWHNPACSRVSPHALFALTFLHILPNGSLRRLQISQRTHVSRGALTNLVCRARTVVGRGQKVCTGRSWAAACRRRQEHRAPGAGARGRCCERRQVAARDSDRPWRAAPPPWAAPARPFCDLPKVPPDAVQDACVARLALIKEPLWCHSSCGMCSLGRRKPNFLQNGNQISYLFISKVHVYVLNYIIPSLNWRVRFKLAQTFMYKNLSIIIYLLKFVNLLN